MNNIFAPGRNSYCVWNVVKSLLQRSVKDRQYLDKDIRRIAALLGIILISLMYYPAPLEASQDQSAIERADAPPFDIPSVIEKAEHLIQKDSSHSDHYWIENEEYRAEFSPSGFDFYQKQGGKREEEYSLRYVLKSMEVSGKSILSGTSLAPINIEDNTVIYHRSPVVKEIYEARREGVEQSWIIEEPLSDIAADLLIQGQLITGLSPVPNKDNGIDLLDNEGNYITSYGKVVVIDQKGRQLTIAPYYENTNLTITIPEAWLAEASYPVIVDPLIGSNIRVDSLADTDNYPAIAFDGTNYLIVWQSGTPNATGTGTTAIKGVRVSNAGSVLDVTPLSIGDTAGLDDEFPSVAYDSLNSRYIVVWMLWKNTTNADIYRNTVTTAGVVGTSTNILTQNNRILSYPSVACCDLNDNYYVVYGRSTNRGTNLTQHMGRTFNRTTHLASVIADPVTVVDSGTITPNSEPRSAPRLYSLSTTQYLLAWETFGVDTNGDVSANMATVDAVPTYTWGTQISVSAAAGMLERYPRAAFDGTNAMIVYQQGATTAADVYGRFVTPGATNLTLGATIPVSTAAGSGQTYPAVAYTSGSCSATPINRYMVVWQDYRNSATNPDIYSAPVDTAGTVGSAVAVSTNTTYIKQLPVIAADSGSCGYLTAWSDYRNNATASSDIYGQRIGYPNISNLSPASGAIGESISINGMNFGADPGAGNRSTAAHNVRLNGTQIADTDVTFWSDTVINFTIPGGTIDGIYPVDVTAEGWLSNASNLTVTNPALQITTSTLSDGHQWINYGANLSASGGVTPYNNWTVIAGALPPGLVLDSNTGLISGTPSSFGTFNFTVQVSDSDTPTPQTATKALSITIFELTGITVTPANPMITQGQTVQFTAMGSYSDSSSSDITTIVNWSSTDTGVATVDSTGLATGVGLGTVNISATK